MSGANYKFFAFAHYHERELIMNKKNDTIALLGGTFDPIHFGHLRMGQEILNLHHFTKIHFVPCYQPVHRQTPVTSPSMRLEMLRLAIADEPRFVADDREIKRESPSYTVDTLLSLREEMPSTGFCLLIGIDAFLEYLTWREPHRILTLSNIIVTHRPNYNLPNSGSLIDFLQQHQIHDAAELQHREAGCIFFQPITPLDISARSIRNDIATQRSPRYLLPDDVYHYIQQNQLYLSK